LKSEQEVRKELEALKKSYPKVLHIKSEVFFQEGMIKALCWVLDEDFHQVMKEIIESRRGEKQK